MVWADIAIGAGLAISAAASVYSTTTQAGIAGQQLGMAQTTQGEQMTSFNQLQQLITNPSSFFSSPIYTAAAGQGASAVAKENAAAYGPNSGNEAAALQKYGQSFGQQQLLSQEQLLASISGVGASASTAQSGAAASGAASAAAGGMNSLAGLLSFFGNSGAGSGAGGSAAATTDYNSFVAANSGDAMYQAPTFNPSYTGP